MENKYYYVTMIGPKKYCNNIEAIDSVMDYVKNEFKERSSFSVKYLTGDKETEEISYPFIVEKISENEYREFFTGKEVTIYCGLPENAEFCYEKKLNITSEPLKSLEVIDISPVTNVELMKRFEYIESLQERIIKKQVNEFGKSNIHSFKEIYENYINQIIKLQEYYHNEKNEIVELEEKAEKYLKTLRQR